MKYPLFKINYVFLIYFLFNANAYAQNATYRDTPECLNEQLTMVAAKAALAQPQVAAGTTPPPGDLEMTGPFGDPLYADPAWEKRSWTQYFSDMPMPRPAVGPVYSQNCGRSLHVESKHKNICAS